MQEILIGGARGEGLFALVDDDDLETFDYYCWYLNDSGYARRTIWHAEEQRYRRSLLHREILGLEEGDPRIGDHINGNRLDNQRSNLRIITAAQNSQNRRPLAGSSSQYRGVKFVPETGKWRATAKLQGKDYSGGVFLEEIEAAQAAKELRLKLMPFTVETL